MNNQKELRNTLRGLLFLSPNIVGFAIFTIFPLGFSLVMAFSNWNLSQHNLFQDEPLRWVLLENFTELLQSSDFWRYLGNTLFFMMGIPLSIAGSLFAAILLSQELKAPSGKMKVRLIITIVVAMSFVCALMAGLRVSLITIFLTGVFGLILVGGVSGGATVYRTLFYTPHFTAGVATFILWKKIYNSQTGPLTHFLQPVLDVINQIVLQLGEGVIHFIMYGLVSCCALLLLWGLSLYLKWRKEGELGYVGLLIGFVFMVIPCLFVMKWFEEPISSQVLQMSLIGIILYFFTQFVRLANSENIYPDLGLGNAIMLGLFVMTGEFLLIGLSNVLYHLPAMAQVSLITPNWLTDYSWAKPSLMFMGFWASIGSNQMLLYLAALTSVSPELGEAADIDGASRFQKFWHVTWPQLAPVTFFIFIMAVINGMQGGFEVAKTMTGGGPAGATTTLEYFIYEEGFASGRLAFASAVSWVLFAMIFALTLFNWRFGNRYVND